MKNFYIKFPFLVLLAINSGTVLAATPTPATRQTVPPPKNLRVSVTSSDCTKGLEELRVKGLKEMQARRNEALAKAKLLPTNEARKEATRKAQDAYNAEMKVAAKQLEAAKAICKKPTPKLEKKDSAPALKPGPALKSSVAPMSKPKPLSVPLVPPVTSEKKVPEVTKPSAESLKPPALPESKPAETVVVPAKPTPPADVSVEISNFAFSPSTIKVKKGTTVIWTNKDGTSHTVTSDTNQFSSDFLGTGQSFKFTFDKTGSFQYHCTPHRNMIATVEVVE